MLGRLARACAPLQRDLPLVAKSWMRRGQRQTKGRGLYMPPLGKLGPTWQADKSKRFWPSVRGTYAVAAVNGCKR